MGETIEVTITLCCTLPQSNAENKWHLPKKPIKEWTPNVGQVVDEYIEKVI